MKKIRIVISVFTLICILSALASCGKSKCEHVYDYECDSECNICGEKREASHHWSKDDKLLCQYQLTCDFCCASVGEDVEHIYTDANGNVLNECAICGAKNPTPPNESNQNNTQGGSTSDVPKENVKTSTFQFNYSYGEVLSYPENVPLANLLINHSYLSWGFDGVTIPKDVTAGDRLIIEHTGEIWIAESYPGQMGLYNGEVVSYFIEYATVLHLKDESFSVEKIKDYYSYKNDYVILNRSGEYVKFDEYTGNEIYLVISQSAGDLSDAKEESSSTKALVACMLAYNPRDIESEIIDFPEELEPITEEKAQNIANGHFQENYNPPLHDGFVYVTELVQDNNYYYVEIYQALLDENGALIDSIDGDSFVYKINKITSEIVYIEHVE